MVCDMTFFSSLSACFYWYTGVNNCAIHRPFALVFQYVFVTDHLMKFSAFFHYLVLFNKQAFLLAIKN